MWLTENKDVDRYMIQFLELESVQKVMTLSKTINVT